METTMLSRRELLYSSAVGAGGVVLSSCTGDEGGDEGPDGAPATDGADVSGDARKGSETTPLEPPDSFSEAPMLAERVAAGGLPPLEERLPDNPYVVPHRWLDPGNYGGNLRMITPVEVNAASVQNKEYSYGHSPLRWLNDGDDIGPGLVASWESNDDLSEWTFHFRTGLRWSDGEPFSTEDVMFWWEDIILNENHPDPVPDQARSGTGTVAEFSAPDDVTLVLTFDAPSPILPAQMADAIGRGGPFGAGWLEPKHYLRDFHPTYNPDVSADWSSADGEFQQKRDWFLNPNSPTMTGWLVTSFEEGRSITLERNPFYWSVDREGAQLPYIDTITVTMVQDQEVGKLQVLEGGVDYVHGVFAGIDLPDMSSLTQAAERAEIEPLLWDSGSGGGSTIAFNYDYIEEKWRTLLREPTFRQALSQGFNREAAREALYFGEGELSTGTTSPKARQFTTTDEGQQVYTEWRESYVEHDPEKAMSLLDELGVVDSDGDGMREFPDGSQLALRLEHRANSSPEHIRKNELIKADWAEIGIAAELTPVPPAAWTPTWNAGELMCHTTWGGFADNPDILSFPGAFVPVAMQYWAPLHARYYALRGTPDVDAQDDLDPWERTPPRTEGEPDDPINRLWQLYGQAKVEPDEMARNRAVWDMVRVHIEEGPFWIGIAINTPRVTVIKNDLRNVPRRENLWKGGWVNPFTHPTPAVYDPEAYYWENPDQHS